MKSFPPRQPLPQSARGAALAAVLRSTIKGDVCFDAGSRALYATDGSNYRQVPIGVVIPRDVDDVIRTVDVCREHKAPILPRGGGTSLAGQGCNVAVVLDLSRCVHHILEIDAERRQARVQPGVILDTLRSHAERYGLTFGPDPATHDRCTLGGMIGNNACGVHSVMAGKTDANVEELEILTYDGLRMRVGQTGEEELQHIIAQGGRRGEIYARLKMLRDRYADQIRERFPDIPRCVSGYNLDQLLPEKGFHVARALVGTEGTCVTVLEATVRLVPSPPSRALVVIGYPDVYLAGDHVPAILAHSPIGLEGFDDRLVSAAMRKGLHPDGIALLPGGAAWLLVEFGGKDTQEAEERARDLIGDLQSADGRYDIRLYASDAAGTVWAVRESALGAVAYVPGSGFTWEGWEDAGVPPARVGDYLRDLRVLLDRYGYETSFYGHFGDGCVHTRMNFDLVTESGIRTFRSFLEDACDLVVSYGGSISGEHGDGQARAELLPKMFGAELVEAFREFKAIWDPQGKMNPGKVVDPYRLDENLRLVTGYRPAPLPTHFSFPEDSGSFATATLRCVGVGKCRKEDGGTMCPSYMVTREEKHSTRGRAHLLFEMLRGQPLAGGWRNEDVREALDLCLACKACKAECPVNVDMATYKAEFLSHYYARRLRPLTAYSMGLIYWWARLASRMAGLVNAVTQAPLLGRVVKALGGVAQRRQIPVFASRPFKDSFRRRASQNQGNPEVLLWPDTFTNHFHPEVAEAAVDVLEAAGFHVVVPEPSLCCGRPLYDYGFLTQAKRLLEQILETLRPQLEAGIPVVVLEPSCLAVFRDELPNLLPGHALARHLHDQSFLLAEFLTKHAPDYMPPHLRCPVVIHGHCHQKALVGMEYEQSILRKSGADVTTLDSGCCGMAGAFGFEKEHYEVSVACGERVLLPAVRGVSAETLIVADGFSCREQIAQLTQKHPLHLAQVLQIALGE